MFYQHYRPKTIEEIDNSQVKEKIASILKTKNLPHAFLFTGQKGTGKTSAARIFAKSVNCLKNAYTGKGDSIEPCNGCSNCLSISSSSSPDVVELDAASNRGIDEIRSLTKEAAFSPMTCRYRVFIIDEAHMITHDAFNALLKTLEEPPESVIFILATTNEEKVPPTIRSRCLIIYFGKAKKEDLLGMLNRITSKEKFKVEDEVLRLVANHSERSFRDAAKLLEELVIQDKLTLEKANEYLGVRSKQNLLEIIQNKPLKDALVWINEFSELGGNTRILIEDMLENLRIALLMKSGVNIDDTENYSFSLLEIVHLMKLLSEAYQNLRFSPQESIPLEIAVAEFYNEKIIKN